jgi:hypothetical protein
MNNKFRIYLNLFIFIFLFAFLPSFVIYQGISHLRLLHKNDNLKLISEEIRHYFSVGKSFESNPKTGLIKAFSDIRNKVFKSKKTEMILEKFRQNLEGNFDYIFWKDKDSKPDFSSEFFNKKYDWKEIWDLIFEIQKSEIQRSFNEKDIQPSISNDSFRKLQNVFGPQITLFKLRKGFNNSSQLFCGDYFNTKSLWWGFYSKNHKQRGLFLIDKKILKSFEFPEYYFASLNSEVNDYQFHFLNCNDIKKVEKNIEKKLVSFVNSNDIQEQTFLESDLYLFFPQKFKKHIVFARLNKKNLLKNWRFQPIYGVLLYLLLFFPCLKIFLQLQNPKNDYFLSISWKISFLFVFAAGIPILVLGFSAKDYLEKKQNTLEELAVTKGFDFLRQFDQNFHSSFEKKEILIKSELNKLIIKMRKEGVKWKLFREFQNRIEPDQVYLKKNEDLMQTRITQAFFIDPSGFVLDMFGKIQNNQYVFQSRKVKLLEGPKRMNLIGNNFIKFYNNQPINAKDSTELELSFEAVFNTSPKAVFTEMLENHGQIFKMGWGADEVPSYINLFSLNENSKKASHMLYLMWPGDRLQSEFIDKQILNSNRNEHGYKIIAIANKFTSNIYPEQFQDSKLIQNFSGRISQTHGFIREIVFIENKAFLAAGFKGINLDVFNLVFLYPYSKIEEEVSAQMNELILAGLVVLLVSILSGLILIRLFLLPIKAITTGVKAIERRDFSFRLNITSDDEFGSLTKILNNTIEDLGELNVAKLVQEKLYPKPGFSPVNFSVYGKTVTLDELGGDYHDFFMVGNHNFATIIGDVSGHGMGAAILYNAPR